MEIHENTCKKLLRDAGEILGPKNECRKQLTGTGWGEFIDACKKVLRETGEHVDIEAR